MQFSANLGFLWSDLPLPEAIRAAHRVGFDAVECHWPFETPATDVRRALKATGLPMLSLNTRAGDIAAGEFGLAALPGREREARAAIDEAIAYAAACGAGAVHVMAGIASGEEAAEVFAENLSYASRAAADQGIDILIEPLNSRDVPGYFLSRTNEAEAIIRRVGAANLKLMFDCYHVALMEGDVVGRFLAVLPVIGHVQFAGVPDRGLPDRGDVDYSQVFRAFRAAGYDAPLGAEYRPSGKTAEGLGWMATLRARG